jgi:hypothetical protein
MDQTLIERVTIAERPGDDGEFLANGHDQAEAERLPLEVWLIVAIVLASYANALWHLLS